MDRKAEHGDDSDDQNNLLAAIRKIRRSSYENEPLPISASSLPLVPLSVPRVPNGTGSSSYVVGNFLTSEKKSAASCVERSSHTEEDQPRERPRAPVPEISGPSMNFNAGSGSRKRHLTLTEGNVQEVEALNLLSSTPKIKTEKRKTKDHLRSRHHGHRVDKIRDRETIKAIKHTPITASEKARSRLEELKQGRRSNLSNQDLFKAFEADKPVQRRNQVVDGIFGPEKQREAPSSNYLVPARKSASLLRRERSNSKVALTPGTVTSGNQNILPPPKKVRPPSTSQSKPIGRSNMKLGQQPRIQQRSPSPRPLTPEPPPLFIQTVPAEDVLDPERLILQWVVNRSTRFSPTVAKEGEAVTVTRDRKKIRGTIHSSKRAANDAACAKLESIQKDVIKKSWVLTGDKELYEGVIEFRGGDVQHFWVEEEICDLAKISEQARKGGKAIHLDQKTASMYARKRYDVWSVVVYPASRAQRDRGGDGQMLLVDCGDGDGSKKEHACNEDDDDSTMEGEGGKVDEEEGMEIDDDIEVGSGDNSADSSTQDSNTQDSNTQDSSTMSEQTTTTTIPSVSPPRYNPPSTNISPFSLISYPETRLHASYTTAREANLAALSVFLDLAKPRNSRIEDHHYYTHFLAPEMNILFHEDFAKDPDTPASLVWDASDASEAGACKWDFLHLGVQVVETELQGVVDLGGMESLVDAPVPAPLPLPWRRDAQQQQQEEEVEDEEVSEAE